MMPRRAAILYEALLPYAGRIHVVAVTANSCVGSVSRQLGLLAAVMSRWNEAEEHFEDTLEMHARMRAHPFLTRTRYEYARMLLARNAPGDQEKALGLLNQAIESARRLGMKRVAERALALRSGAEGEVQSAATEAARPSIASARGNLFRREGDYWTIAYEGSLVRMRDSKGLRYIAHLLEHPGKELHVADLLGGGGGNTDADAQPTGAPNVEARGDLGDAGELLDPRARDEYRRRIDDLRAELEEATRWADGERAARIREEMDFVSEELSAAFGLGGRARKGADTVERMRKAVTGRIRDTLVRIEREHPALEAHLANALRLGAFCRYSPEKPVSWSL